MFKFLYRFSFFRYINCLCMYPATGKQMWAMIGAISFYSFFLQAATPSGIEMGPAVSALGVTFFTVAMVNTLIAYYSSSSSSVKLSALQPLTVKRKILYNFLAPVWVSFVLLVVMAVIALIVYAIMLIVVAVVGSTISSSESTGEAIGFYGGTAFVCFCIIAYCSSMQLSFLAHTKQMVRCTLYTLGCIVLLALGTSLPATARGINSEVFGNECYTATNTPWVFAAVWICLAATQAVALVREVILYYRKQREL